MITQDVRYKAAWTAYIADPNRMTTQWRSSAIDPLIASVAAAGYASGLNYRQLVTSIAHQQNVAAAITTARQRAQPHPPAPQAA